MLDLGFAGILIIGRIIRYVSSAYLKMTLCDDTGCMIRSCDDIRGRPYGRTLDYAGRDFEGI